MREQIVMPAIRSREIAEAQRSRIRHRKHAFQPLDFGNGLFSVHPSQYLTQWGRGQTASAVCFNGFLSVLLTVRDLP